MKNYSSNCYGFMHAGLLNSKGEFYLSRDEAFKGIKGIKVLDKKLDKIQLNTSDNIVYCLSENSENSENKYSIIEIFDGDERSQHVAFLDYDGNFYDQDGPDGPIRLGKNIDYLLDEYKEKLGGTAYYQIHILNKDLSMNVENFLNDLK